MRWPWQPAPVPENPEVPRGVVLHWNGRVIPCSMLRDPDQDEPGCAAWLAVPGEAVRIGPGQFFSLKATGRLPDGCLVLPGFTIDETARR